MVNYIVDLKSSYDSLIILLQRHANGFKTHTYKYPDNNTDYESEAVGALNISIHHVYKTLARRLNSMEMVVVFLPVAAQLNLKLLALAAGAKKTQLALPKQAKAATCYLLRGISPLA